MALPSMQRRAPVLAVHIMQSVEATTVHVTGDPHSIVSIEQQFFSAGA